MRLTAALVACAALMLGLAPGARAAHYLALGYRVITRAFLSALAKVGEHLRGRIDA